ncbi:glycosyltransferase [Falsiroseomonas bella]|uniref:Glycosyltransferase n=1 Tax=Falsiroseomonas bella TaxID=2184016 RepID=A0A317FG48_9PROT|nr:glycosyltransferase [Falsiroseomonas bella]PWS37017.1 glycosyltransferase [Falsiroseomonas bella]
MKLVVFGLSITSSWGNGHATLWRALCRALGEARHRVLFFERDRPWYAETRETLDIPGLASVVHPDWAAALARAAEELRGADAAIVTSYCADACAAASLLQDAPRVISVFYDLDTPVTLARLAAGERPDYIPPDGLGGFDLVLSYTGGEALAQLRDALHARRVVPLYGSVDPATHHATAPVPAFAADLSYLGTYAADRQPALERLMLEPARRRPERRFVMGGAQYPQDFPWEQNIHFVRHLPASEHPAFFSSSRLTLNVTRRDMAALGWCPSGRLFEAAACGTPVLSDRWDGIESFYTPGEEILLADDTEGALEALDMDEAERLRIARRARERTLAEHTGAQRARELLAALQAARAPAPVEG